MTDGTRRIVAGAVAGAAALATILLLLVYAPGWWRGEGGTYAPRAPVASLRVEPASALFGDTLTARASVLVDASTTDLDEVRVSARFAPYAIVSRSRTVTDDVGRAARVDYTFHLRCLNAACLDAMDEETKQGSVVPTAIRFPPGEVATAGPGGTIRREQLRWPAVIVRSRLAPEDIQVGEPQVPVVLDRSVSYRISPGLLGWVLALLAGALALAGGALVAIAVRGRRAATRLVIPGHLTPVERALALARHAAAEGDVPGERRALQRLAAELRRTGDRDLAVAAGRLAWSAGTPGDELDELEAAAAARSRNGGSRGR
jgi:hypothetical protein